MKWVNFYNIWKRQSKGQKWRKDFRGWRFEFEDSNDLCIMPKCHTQAMKISPAVWLFLGRYKHTIIHSREGTENRLKKQFPPNFSLVVWQVYEGYLQDPRWEISMGDRKAVVSPKSPLQLGSMTHDKWINGIYSRALRQLPWLEISVFSLSCCSLPIAIWRGTLIIL